MFCFCTNVFKSTVPFCTREPELPVGLLARGADDLQQEEEDLDDVDVEGERSKHILIGTDGVLPVSYQKLRVVCQELQNRRYKNSR